MAVAVELRTVNNRYFKLSARLGDGYDAWEPRIESIVRQRVRRGTVQVSVRVDRDVTSRSLSAERGRPRGISPPTRGVGRSAIVAPRWESLLALPGAVVEHASEPGEIEAGLGV